MLRPDERAEDPSMLPREGSPLLHVEQSADSCIKCNICNTVCPVSAVTDLFPGPKYEGPQGQRFRAGIVHGESPDISLDYCSSCGLCTQSCPEGVMVAEINSVARSRLVEERGGLKWRDKIVCRPTLMGNLARPVAPLANVVLANKGIRVLIEKVMGVHRDAAMPKFSSITFQSWARRHQAPANPKRTVAYFHGCATQEYEPFVGTALMRVLERNGVKVTVPKQNCCGLPLISNGDYVAARRFKDRLVSKLRPSAEDDGVIVANSTSCSMTLKSKYRELLGANDENTEVVSKAVWDVSEYLVDLYDQDELDLNLGRIDETAIYHTQCQLTAHGVGAPGYDLVSLIPGLKVELSTIGCCGMAGTYGTKKEKYGIAMDVGSGLWEMAERIKPSFIVCDSETCRWHIAKATGLPVYHPVQVLDRAYAAADGRPQPEKAFTGQG
jgi:glycerol-3-phosphate dehydrogenase subunit C